MNFNNFEHLFIGKLSYIISLAGYTTSQIVLPDTPLFNNFLKFYFGLLLFVITYFLKHFLDKKFKKDE